MALYSLLFSPTGGTKKVSEIIINEFSQQPIIIDLTDNKFDFGKTEINSSDFVFAAVPSYAGRVPEPAVRRIEKIKGNGSKAVLICVFGNREYEDTLIELYDVLSNNGFNVIAAVSAVAQHSIVKEIASNRPDEKDCMELCEFAVKIKRKLEMGIDTKPDIPGNRPYKQVSSSKLIPYATNECVKCGACSRQCPCGAIDINNPLKTDNSKCIACMRCVDLCKYSARKTDSNMFKSLSDRLLKLCSDRKNPQLYI